MRIPYLATSLLLLGVMQSLHAELVTVVGRNINLPLPRGYCAVKDQGTEGQLVTRTREGLGAKNRLLLLFANCDELKALRTQTAGTPADGFNDYGTFTVLLKDGDVRLFDQYTRQQYIDNVANAITHGQGFANGIRQAEERLRDISSIRQLESLGVLDTDANALYVGFAGQNTATNQGMLGVGGSTLVNGVNLTVTAWWSAKSPNDVDRLLTQQKYELAAVVATNK